MALLRRVRLDRTLGQVVARWVERNLVHGPGDVQGQPVRLDDEQVLFLLRCYELDDRGRRLVRRAVYSRPKGRAKTELAAMIACAEGLGPVRFAGWGHDGRPEGRPVVGPYVRCAATEEGQAGQTYDAAAFMLREGPVSKTAGLDVGISRTFLPGGGRLEAVTSKSASKEGGLETFCVLDETGLYVRPELHQLAAVLRRNLAKRRAAEPWSLETTVMYAPGEGSVAEGSHAYAQALAAGRTVDPSFVFDHRAAPDVFDFDDDLQLRAALAAAYGAAAEWVDLDRLVAEARDPQSDRNDFRRFFLNQPAARSAGRWIADEAWRACAGEAEIPPLAGIVVGVDAAHTRDTTACVWTWRSPEGLLVQRSRVWSCRGDVPHDMFVPGGRLDNDLVRDFVRDVLADGYRVDAVLGDERYFADQLAELAEEDGLVVVWIAQGSKQMSAAWDEFYGYVHSGRVEHAGDPVYAAHVRAAVGVKTDRGWKVSKRRAQEPIDCLAAGVMSAYGCAHLAEFAPPPALSWRPL